MRLRNSLMNSIFLFRLWLVSMVIGWFGCVFAHANQNHNPCVLVSVAPHKFFVEQIAQNTVEVHLMVPAGASAHTYEPTPRQMLKAGRAELWFCIGEAFEKRAIQALTSHYPSLVIIDLRQGLALIDAEHRHGCKGCCSGGADLHFWLSARQAQIQAQRIAEALSNAYPQHAPFYRDNLATFQRELRELDAELSALLTPLKNRAVLVSHPAYAYFCRDYELEQYSIEMEGKDPTPQQMTRLLQVARKLQVHTIFIQMQYSRKAAELLAHTLHAKLVLLDPYGEDYFRTMREIAHAFANQDSG